MFTAEIKDHKIASKYGKGPYIAGVTVFNHLPQKFKALAQNPNKFKTSVKKFVLSALFLLN